MGTSAHEDTLRGEETPPVPLGGEGEAASKPHSPGSNSRILALTVGYPRAAMYPVIREAEKVYSAALRLPSAASACPRERGGTGHGGGYYDGQERVQPRVVVTVLWMEPETEVVTAMMVELEMEVATVVGSDFCAGSAYDGRHHDLCCRRGFWD